MGHVTRCKDFRLISVGAQLVILVEFKYHFQQIGFLANTRPIFFYHKSLHSLLIELFSLFRRSFSHLYNEILFVSDVDDSSSDRPLLLHDLLNDFRFTLYCSVLFFDRVV